MHAKWEKVPHVPIPASFVYAVPGWAQGEREKGNVCRSFYSEYSEYTPSLEASKGSLW